MSSPFSDNPWSNYTTILRLSTSIIHPFSTMYRYVHPHDNKKQEAIKNVSLLLQGEG